MMAAGRLLATSLSGLGVLAAIAFPGTAWAQAEAIHLEYRADEGCPDAASFFAQVQERTARARLASTNESARTFVVTLARGRAGTIGRLAIQEHQRLTVARQLTGEQCGDVASALALATALAIDPLASLLPTGDTGRAVQDPPAERSTPPPPDRKPQRPAEDRRWLWRAGGSFTVGSRIAPRLSVGGSGFVERETSDPGALLSSVRLSLTWQQAPETAVESAFSSFRFFYARPELCTARLRMIASLTAVPCLAVHLGLVSASGSRIATPLSDNRFWAAGEFVARLRHSMSSLWFLEAELGLVFPITRHRYFFRDPDILIHAVPPLVVMGSAGLGISFP